MHLKNGTFKTSNPIHMVAQYCSPEYHVSVFINETSLSHIITLSDASAADDFENIVAKEDIAHNMQFLLLQFKNVAYTRFHRVNKICYQIWSTDLVFDQS